MMTADDYRTSNVRIGGVTSPASEADERTTLMGFLQRQRDLIVWKVSDASDETLASVRTESGLTMHGVVRHLENVERGWFRDFFAGETDLRFDGTEEDPEGDFRAEGVPIADLITAYAAETARCDTVIQAAPSFDSLAKGSEAGTCSLRWIVLHMIEETGRHVGHLDLLREQADGAVGEDPPRDEPNEPSPN